MADLDQPIIDFCEEHRSHTDVGKVFAKIALVNRVYRANLEKGVRRAEAALATMMVEEHADRFLEPLWAVTAFDRSTLASVLTAHGWLVVMGKRATERVALSIASKYLSFHHPAVVPLYDDKARLAAFDLVGSRIDRAGHAGFLNTPYARFCECILLLQDELREHGEQPDLQADRRGALRPERRAQDRRWDDVEGVPPQPEGSVLARPGTASGCRRRTCS